MSVFNTLEFLISMDSFGYEMLAPRLVKLRCSCWMLGRQKADP